MKLEKKTSTITIVLIIIIIISLVGGIIVIYATLNGPWGYTDPVVYISTARNIINGNGIGYFEANAKFNPLSHYPPFIPILLSIVGAFKIDLIDAFRWINILAFMATIFISGWIFLRYTNKPFLGIMASALMCFFPIIVIMFSSTYSEPVFIFLIMVGGVVIFEYIRNEKILLFILGALLIGLVPLTRYIGVSILASSSIFILLFTRGSILKRIWKATKFGFLASLPILVWFVYVYGLAGPASGKWSINPNIVDFSEKFQEFRGLFMDVICKWLPFQSITNSLQYSTRYIILSVGILVFVGLSLSAYQRLRGITAHNWIDSGIQILAFFGISAVTFLIVLIISFLFSYPTVAIDNRMLLPFYVLSVMCLFGGFALWQHTWHQEKIRWLQFALGIIIIICVCLMITKTIDTVNFYHSGIGLTANKWRKSETILAVNSLPKDQPVISNDWELLQLWTGRPVLGFWRAFTADPDQALICNKGSALVLFTDYQEQLLKLYKPESLEKLNIITAGLPVIGEFPDGIIYLCH